MQAEWMLQYTEEFKSEADAIDAFAMLRTQCDYKGGRILPPNPSRPAWFLQTFFADVAPTEGGHAWYPDGIRRVIVLPNLRRDLGINA